MLCVMAEIGSDYVCMSDECSQDFFSLWPADSWSVGDSPVYPTLPSVFDDPLGSPLDDLPLASPSDFYKNTVETLDTEFSPNIEGQTPLHAAYDPEWVSEVLNQVCTDKIFGCFPEPQDGGTLFAVDEELIDNISVETNSDTLSVADSGRHSVDVYGFTPNSCDSEGGMKVDRSPAEFLNVIQDENRNPDRRYSHIPDISEHSYGTSLRLPAYYTDRRLVRLPGGKMRLDAARQHLTSKNPASRDRTLDVGQSSQSTYSDVYSLRKNPKRVATRRTEIVSTSDISTDEEQEEERDEYVYSEVNSTSRRRRNSSGRNQTKSRRSDAEVTSTRRGGSKDVGASDVNKNAMNARMNRQKKKAYISSLEKQRARLGDENRRLKSAVSELAGERDDLRDEVDYLKSVLANESVLARLIEGINGGPTRLSGAMSSTGRKRKFMEDSGPEKVVQAAPSGGVCLHVRQDQMSLEFCHSCARMSVRGRGVGDDGIDG